MRPITLTPYGFRFFEGEGGGGGNNTEKKVDHPQPEEKKEGEKVPVASLIEERKKRQASEAELDKLKAEIKAKEDEELKKKGEIEKLLDAEKAEHTKTKQELESMKIKASEYDALQAVERAELKTQLGTQWEEEFDSMPLPTLKKIASKLTVSGKLTPAGDGGAGGDGNIKLTDAEKAEAQRMGLSEEGFIRFKNKKDELQTKK